MKTITPKSLDEFRNWLSKNYDKENKVSVVCFKKHTGQPWFRHHDLMCEAICFGWIDTTIKRIDDEKFVRNFSRRTDKSRWSNNTLSYAKRLVEEKKMTPPGLIFYEEGSKKPVIDFILPEGYVVLDDLKKELSKKKNSEARKNFGKLSNSVKTSYFKWIERAKQKDTRERRARNIVEALGKGKGVW